MKLIIAAVITLFGLLMLTVSFIVPPTGQIDPSVIAAFGEILTFAGTVIGIDYKYKH
ncbi:MAG: hypothetical protein IJ680_05660 [Paludibacteraceae bacterium]|nr:hypothetical protein [Paludibacteraceae bacterium]